MRDLEHGGTSAGHIGKQDEIVPFNVVLQCTIDLCCHNLLSVVHCLHNAAVQDSTVSGTAMLPMRMLTCLLPLTSLTNSEEYFLAVWRCSLRRPQWVSAVNLSTCACQKLSDGTGCQRLTDLWVLQLV